MRSLRRHPREKHGFPYLEGAFPVVGTMPRMYFGLRRLLDDAERRLGPFFWMDLGFGAEVLMCRHLDGLVALRNKTTTSTHYQVRAHALLGDSLIVQDGAKHHHMRSALNGPFTPKGLSAAEVGPIMAETIETRVRSWALGRELRVLAATRELALSVIFRIIGIPSSDLGAWRHQYEEFVLSGLNIPIDLPGFPRWRGRRARTWLDERLLGIIQQARHRREGGGGLLAYLVEARDEAGEALTDHELVENLRLLALAGHETSATTMAWMVIELGRDPVRWRRLCDEALAGGGVPQAPRELKQFPFAEALFREALRLHPPVTGVSRQVTGPLEVAGRAIPMGSEFSLDLDHLSRHESLYEDPDRFLPERWLEKSEAISPVEILQFGGGPHFCLGYHLAWMEVVQFAVALARALAPLGLRPVTGEWPRTHFLPIAHPAPGTRIRWDRTGR